MIKTMIDTSFSAYGCIEPVRLQKREKADPISIRPLESTNMYCFKKETCWDYVDGMTILVIQDGGMLKRFYLDRAVTVYAGVRFGFYPLGQGSTIAGDASLLEDENCVDRIKAAAEPAQLKQLEIFTLFRQEGRDGLYFRGERHQPLELVYLEKGVLRNYCEGQELVLHPAELLIFGPNQWHMQYTDEQVQFLTISFSWEGQDFSGCLNRVVSAPAEIQRSIYALLNEYDQSLPGRDEFLNAQMKLLLLQILRLPGYPDVLKKPSPVSERIHRQIIDEAMQTVSARIYGKLTVSELAAAVNVSTSQLTALFKAYLGVAPAKYITRIRLEESKVLLEGRQMSVGEVAQRLGYSSIQHFSKQFGTWFGFPPSAYAKKEE